MSIISACFAAYSSAAANDAQHRAMIASQRNAAEAQALYASFTPRAKPSPSKSKCPCCGSREFQPHNQRMICAYCRSG